MPNTNLILLCALATILLPPGCSRQQSAESTLANSETNQPTQPSPTPAEPTDPPSNLPPLTTDWEYQVVYMVAPGPHARSIDRHKQGMENFFNQYLGSGGWEYVGVVASRNPSDNQSAAVTYTLWRRPRSQPSNYVRQQLPQPGNVPDRPADPVSKDDVLSVAADGEETGVAARR